MQKSSKNMRYILSCWVIATLVSPSFAKENHKEEKPNVSEESAIQLIDCTIKYFQTHGQDEALKAFNDLNGPYCHKYKFGHEGINVATTGGVLLASCKYPGLVGTNVLGWQSPDGKFINQIIIKAAQENPYGVVIVGSITNLNPMTGKQSGFKHFARKDADLIFFTHIYNPTPLHKELPSHENIEAAQNP